MPQPRYILASVPFSTFTRTISMALHYKGLPFEYKYVMPNTADAFEGHPYGYLPCLIIRDEEGKEADVRLCESQAIARYLDRIAPDPSLNLGPGDGVVEEKMWEFISLYVCWGFPALNNKLVKPQIFAMDLGKSTEEVAAWASSGIEPSQKFLSHTDSLMSDEGPYFYGERLTWADLFLFPIVADVRMTPECKQVMTPKLMKWADTMDELKEVKATKEGTFSASERPHFGWTEFVMHKISGN